MEGDWNAEIEGYSSFACVTVAGDGEDDAGDEWRRRTEHRYISSVVLDKLSQQDAAVPMLCQARVLAHLTSVIRENRIQREAGPATASRAVLKHV